jgi:phenylalanine-4-hydroxylase
VTRRPFVTAQVIETDYDPSRMQDHLFVIPSYAWLRNEAEQLVARLQLI